MKNTKGEEDVDLKVPNVLLINLHKQDMEYFKGSYILFKYNLRLWDFLREHFSELVSSCQYVIDVNPGH